ncbi:MAG: efflux RND transporter permease subunit [Bacteriovoracaceae bacterium]
MKFNLANWFSKVLHFHPGKLLLCGILLIAALIPGYFYLTKDFSFRHLSSPSNPKLANFDLFEKHFGNDDSVAVIIHNPTGIFNQETLLSLKKLEEELLMLPGTMRAESLLDGNTITSTVDAIEIQGLVPKNQIEQLTSTDLEKLKARALAAPNIVSYLVSPDSTLTFIYLYLKPTRLLGQTEIFNYSKSVEAVVETHKKTFPQGSEILLSGPAYLSKTVVEVSRNDQRRLAPIILFFFALIAFITFRNLKGVAIIIFMIVINVLCSMGIQAYLGIPINAFTASVGIIITTITTGAVIHVVNGFYRYYRKTGDAHAALVLTYQVNFVPTFLTSFTTAVGFFSLADKSLMPVYQLGIILGFGTMISWIIIITVIGPILRFTHKQKVLSTIGPDGLPIYSLEPDKDANQFSKKYVAFINRNKKTIIGIWLLLFVASIAVLPTLEVKMNPFTQFSSRLPIVYTKNMIKEKMGFSIYIDLLVDTGEVDGGKKAETLKNLSAFEEELKLDPEIIKNVSITSIIKEMNQIFNGNKQDTYQIPVSNEAIAQYLLLYSFSDNGKLKNFISSDGRFLRSTIFTSKEDSNQILKQMDHVEALAKKHHLKVLVTGKMPLYMELGLVVFKVIGQSALVSLLLIGFIMFFLVKNVKLGIVSMIPNVVPVVIGGGIMKLMGFGIDIGVTLVFSVCLGIAVDDTIHFIHHWLHLRKEGKTEVEALELIVVNLFPMVIATTVILSIGFGVLAFADFLPNVKFGVLTSVILSVAMFADLFMLPSILLHDQKKKES